MISLGTEWGVSSLLVLVHLVLGAEGDAAGATEGLRALEGVYINIFFGGGGWLGVA